MTAIFLSILRMSITGSFVIFLVLLCRLCFRRMPKAYSYVLWAVVLFRLVCPLSVSAPVSALSLADRPVNQLAQVIQTAQETYPDNLSVPTANMLPDGDISDKTGTLQDNPPSNGSVFKQTPFLLKIVSYVWLAGTIGMLLWGIIPLWKLRRILAEAVPAGDHVYMADHIPSPFVLGILFPRIYLPSGLSEKERAYILLHENYHIRHRDSLFKTAGFLVLCLHWFNPLVWLSFLLASRDMEMRCDEAVVKNFTDDRRKEYASTLLRLTTGNIRIGGMPLAFGEGNTMQRIRHLSGLRRPKIWISILAVLFCILLMAACAVNPPEPSEDEKPMFVGNVIHLSEDTLIVSPIPGFLPEAYGEIHISLSQLPSPPPLETGNEILVVYDGEPNLYTDTSSQVWVNQVYEITLRSNGKKNNTASLQSGFLTLRLPADMLTSVTAATGDGPTLFTVTHRDGSAFRIETIAKDVYADYYNAYFGTNGPHRIFAKHNNLYYAVLYDENATDTAVTAGERIVSLLTDQNKLDTVFTKQSADHTFMENHTPFGFFLANITEMGDGYIVCDPIQWIESEDSSNGFTILNDTKDTLRFTVTPETEVFLLAEHWTPILQTNYAGFLHCWDSISQHLVWAIAVDEADGTTVTQIYERYVP